MSRSWGYALLAAVATHLLAAAWLLWSERAGDAVSADAAVPLPVQVRIHVAAEHDTSPPTTREAVDEPYPAESSQPATITPGGPLPAPPAVVQPAVGRELPSVDGYVLRRALTRAPVPLAEIDPPWPAGLAPNDAQRGVFTLFISEAGVVDRMEPDGPSLFPALEASARSAFMAARFQPGEVEGRPVKSLIRIEVVFEPRATSVPGATVISRQNL